MKLDPQKRYLLSRPHGGLNDMLVQIEKTAVYAEKYNRVLVIDTRRAGLREPLDEVFELSERFGPKAYVWCDGMTEDFDAVTSVHPPSLAHRISTYRTKWDKRRQINLDRSSGETVGFDFGCDHPEQVLVHEQPGGGRVSLRALRRLRLRADIANIVVSRLAPLGRGYDAVHIRHSDYKTGFRRMLLRLRPVLHRRRVLICSDSIQVKKTAKRVLHSSTTVLSVSDIPHVNGSPLHRTRKVDVHTTNIDMVCDLFAMALSDTLFFSRLSIWGARGAKYSGFSVLAEMLRRNKDVIGVVLANADPDQLSKLLAESPDVTGRSRQIQLWAQRAINTGPRDMDAKMKLVESGAEIPFDRV